MSQQDTRKHASTFSLATKLPAWPKHLQNFWTHALNQRGSLQLTYCLHIWVQHLTHQSSCLTTCHCSFYGSYKTAVTYSGIVCGPVSEMQCGTIHPEAGDQYTAIPCFWSVKFCSNFFPFFTIVGREVWSIGNCEDTSESVKITNAKALVKRKEKRKINVVKFLYSSSEQSLSDGDFINHQIFVFTS